MAGVTLKNLLVAILKGLISVAESSKPVKLATVIIAELGAAADDRSAVEEKAPGDDTFEQINALLGSLEPEDVSGALQQLDLATNHAAFSAAGIQRLEKALQEQSAALQLELGAIVPKIVESILGILASHQTTAGSPERVAQQVLVPCTHKLPEVPSPANLLNARYGAVPFHHEICADTWADLEEWCADQEPVSARLFVGPGGSGKTRIFIEFARSRSEAGWRAGFWPDTATLDDLETLLAADQPTLAVMDYAETRPELLRMLKRIVRVPRTAPLRVVLVAREVADWWRSLLKRDDEVQALLDLHAPTELRPVPLEGPVRQQVFERAHSRFAELRPDPRPAKPVDLSDDRFGRPLYIHMAALAVVEGLDPTADALLDGIVTHEERFWPRRFADTHPDNHYKEAEFCEAAARTVAAVTLRGGVDEYEQGQRVNQLASGPSVDGFVRFLHSLYPDQQRSSESTRPHYLSGLQPDLLGEQLIIQVLSDEHTPRQYLLDIFSDNDARAISQAFIVLGRVSLRHERANRWMTRLLDADVNGRAKAAFQAAMTLGEVSAYAELGRTLAARLKGTGTAELAAFIEKSSPQQRVSLGELRLWATQRLLDACPDDTQDEESTIERARLLNNLGAQLSALGQREKALEATREAVDHYRPLAEARPDAFLPDLARSLNNLGILLSYWGEQEDALEATREAVELRRQLAKSLPDSFLPDLATSLNSLGNRLSDLGKSEEAFEAAREAVEHYRQVAKFLPDAFLPDLAGSLNNLGNRLRDLGQREEALAATREAVELRRQLARSRPDAFLPDLAESLTNLGAKLRDLGQREEAAEATREAVEFRRQLAQSRPFAFLPDLAGSLNNLGALLSELGKREEALEATREAAELRRQLAKSRPDAFLPDLAGSLTNLGAMLSGLGRREEALEAAREAAEHCRQLAQERPAAFLPYLATSLNNLGNRLSELGQREEALAATREAVEHYRLLVQARPDALLPDLAGSLTNLGARLRELGQHDEALDAAREAVQHYVRVVPTTRTAYLPHLKTAVQNLTDLLKAKGQDWRNDPLVIEALVLCVASPSQDDSPNQPDA